MKNYSNDERLASIEIQLNVIFEAIKESKQQWVKWNSMGVPKTLTKIDNLDTKLQSFNDKIIHIENDIKSINLHVRIVQGVVLAVLFFFAKHFIFLKIESDKIIPLAYIHISTFIERLI